jgi:hypothetical protein
MSAWRPGRLAIALCACFAWAGGAAAAAIDVAVTGDVVHAARGTTQTVTATLTNLGPQVVYLDGITSGVTSDFAGGDLFDSFAATRPDSLGPGESWEGPVLQITVSPNAPLGIQTFDLSLTGGDNPYANDALGFTFFAIDDSTGIVSVPDDRRTGVTFDASPNPFQRVLRIDFVAPETGRYDVAVFDVSGRRVAQLHSGELKAGSYHMTWDSRATDAKAANGVFFVRVTHGDRMLKTKVLKLE